jgi:hypothetical protein
MCDTSTDSRCCLNQVKHPEEWTDNNGNTKWADALAVAHVISRSPSAPLEARALIPFGVRMAEFVASTIFTCFFTYHRTNYPDLFRLLR